MFGKVNPAPAVSKCVRMVCRSLLAPQNPLKPVTTIQKHDSDENHGFFGFLWNDRIKLELINVGWWGLCPRTPEMSA